MLLSLNWLKDYVDIPKNVAAKQLAYDLTMATVEVESIKSQAEQFEKMVVGKVAELKNHPNANKLRLAITDVGEIKKLRNKEIKGNANNLVQIVCGGVNLREGMLVAVALPGAKVCWHGEGDAVELEEAKIRGEKSFGMICASNEIGLESRFPNGEMEIADFSNVQGVKPGQPLAQALGLDDVIIEIDNKSLTNRPDLWNHYGIARELAAIYNLKLKTPELLDESVKDVGGAGALSVEIQDKNLCSRYLGCLVKNIKISPSPEGMQKRLEAVGLRAINNVVDITNYVLMDVGEPTHAFDAKKLANESRMNRELSRIIIRNAKSGEKIKTLDGENRKLDESMLVIADNQKPVALAGVMGGASSEVSDKTKEIVLEAAIFEPASIRRTSIKLNHRTESSIRFEKNLDPALAELAMLRMLKLIKELIPGAEVAAWVDEDFSHKKKIYIKVKHEFLEKRIGQKFNLKEVIGILNRLGFGGREKSGVYTVEVPSWRATGDVSIPEDIVEEVARIYGYDNLKEKLEMIEMTQAKHQPEFELERKVKSYLSLSCGMNEVFNYAWADEKMLKSLGLSNNLIEIANPPADENKYLQPSLIPNLIKNVHDNLRFFSQFKIFEIARVFKVGEEKFDGDDKLPEQPKMLAGAVVAKEDAFKEIKGILENLLKLVGIDEWWNCFVKFNEYPKYYDQNKNLSIMINDERIGWLGEFKEKIKNKNVALFEVDFSQLVKCVSREKKYQPLPQHPSIERDIAIEVGWQVKWSQVKDEILNPLAGRQDDIIKKIEFISEYDLGNKKSLAFRVTYQADRTLKDEEVEVVEKKIVKMLEKKFNANLRK